MNLAKCKLCGSPAGVDNWGLISCSNGACSQFNSVVTPEEWNKLNSDESQTLKARLAETTKFIGCYGHGEWTFCCICVSRHGDNAEAMCASERKEILKLYRDCTDALDAKEAASHD